MCETGYRRSPIMRNKDTAIFTCDEPLHGCQKRDRGEELLLCRRVYVIWFALRLLLVPFLHVRDALRLLAHFAPRGTSVDSNLTTAGGEQTLCARFGPTRNWFSFRYASIESLGIVLMNANTTRAVNPVFTVTPSSKIQRKKHDQVENCILNVHFLLFPSLEPLAAGRSALVGAEIAARVCTLLACAGDHLQAARKMGTAAAHSPLECKWIERFAERNERSRRRRQALS